MVYTELTTKNLCYTYNTAYWKQKYQKALEILSE